MTLHTGARRSLFFPVENPINQSVYPSRASEIESAVSTETSLSRPSNKILSAPSPNSGGRSQTDLAQGALGRDKGSIERFASLLL